MPVSDEPNRHSVAITMLAKAATRSQLDAVDDLLSEAGIPLDAANRLTMLQILATNYAAEVMFKKKMS